MTPTSIDALVLVDKPAGVTSFDVVAAVRRSLGTRRVGHAGTLDPFATGLLVVLTGRGTRLIRFVPVEPKVYEAEIRFGVATDTDDLTGQVIAEAPIPDVEAVRAAIPTLTGTIRQLPPDFSAKHVDGERAYDVARRGDRPALAESEVVVHSWEVGVMDGGMLRCRIACGTGTYIRALARDLGRLTGSAAHLTSLRRVSAGPFEVSRADTLDDVRAGRVTRHPLVEALVQWPRQALAADDVLRISRGMRVGATVDGVSRALLTDESGALLAVAARAGDSWQPEVVLANG